MDINSIGNAATNNTQLSPGSNPVVSAPVLKSSDATTVVPTVASSSTQSNQASGSPAPSLAQVKQAVDNINASLQANGNQQGVQFAVDPSSKRVVVQVIDPETNKVIRQIPSEEIIQMSMSIGQKLGQVINQQA